ncbi:unnamed protein product [Darwinula stevensoni]|uniref:Uncharacterized protein n=1 Tax=Darwinula stevensoni TaxID=69355 RepID=A0A7R9AG46_9CRUS|nr:unnamed protein product [Darwinula stevensoni]CAG0903887.1 unnamed protein product [Darwinula stevensoni]
MTIYERIYQTDGYELRRTWAAGVQALGRLCLAGLREEAMATLSSLRYHVRESMSGSRDMTNSALWRRLRSGVASVRTAFLLPVPDRVHFLLPLRSDNVSLSLPDKLAETEAWYLLEKFYEVGPEETRKLVDSIGKNDVAPPLHHILFPPVHQDAISYFHLSFPDKLGPEERRQLIPSFGA